MAKRNNEPTTGSNKAKVRVFFAEVEGNNESVQEALKTMVAAMSRPVRVIAEQKPSGPEALLAQISEAEEAQDSDDHFDETETASDEEADAGARKPRGSGKRVDRN